jgi:hypothetical protein
MKSISRPTWIDALMAFAGPTRSSVYPSAGARVTAAVAKLPDSPGWVLDQEGLIEPAGQPLPHQAGESVIGTAGWKADDQTHRPRRIGLRARRPQPGGKQRGKPPETQQPAARTVRHCRYALKNSMNRSWTWSGIGMLKSCIMSPTRLRS